jgi:hypothetical protein
MSRFAALAVIGLTILVQPLAFAGTVQEAKQALEAGRAATAADMLRRHVQQEPRDYEAWFLLGVAETQDKRYQRAISAFRRVIELRPKLAEPHDNLAAIYNQLDDVQSAVQELEQSLQKRPGHAATEENLGDLHLKLALAYYRRALEREQRPTLAERYARLLQVRDPHAALAAAGPVADTSQQQTRKAKPVQQPTPEAKPLTAQPGKDKTTVAVTASPAAPKPVEKPAMQAPVATPETAKPATPRPRPKRPRAARRWWQRRSRRGARPGRPGIWTATSRPTPTTINRGIVSRPWKHGSSTSAG